MKEKKTIIILKFIFLSSITFYFLLSLIKSDLSYSKLTEDIMKDINNYKYAIQINKTHFSCDEGNNILDIIKLNDDFCDCADGADENSN